MKKLAISIIALACLGLLAGPASAWEKHHKRHHHHRHTMPCATGGCNVGCNTCYRPCYRTCYRTCCYKVRTCCYRYVPRCNPCCGGGFWRWWW